MDQEKLTTEIARRVIYSGREVDIILKTFFEVINRMLKRGEYVKIVNQGRFVSLIPALFRRNLFKHVRNEERQLNLSCQNTLYSPIRGKVTHHLKMIRNNIIMILVIISITLPTSCAGSNQARITLESNSWQLANITLDEKENQVFYGKDCFIITFCKKDSTINGMGVCNSFMGRYESGEKGTLIVKMGTTTMKSCLDKDKEQAYFTMLNLADSYKIENYELVLFHGEKECARFAPLEMSTNPQATDY